MSSDSNQRPSWDQHWMETAHLMAQMSTCASGRRVGAVFVRDKRLLATGFNGVPSGYPHPQHCARRLAGVPSGQGLDLCVCAHAEANGIANAARHGMRLEGATVYVTHQPCAGCMGESSGMKIPMEMASRPKACSGAILLVFSSTPGRAFSPS
ncbi:MAG: dCMP deaminase family protein, partial [Magnetococcus sp. WYHC-3]